jgi:hypothetical protein
VKRTCLIYVTLTALVLLGEKRPSGMKLWAQAAQARHISLPIFEVDRAWPKVPEKWKLGNPSSIAIDARDNVWVLTRPREIKPEWAAEAAPPVIVFDTAGNYTKSWGGNGDGYEWPQREHGIYIDFKGFVWIGGMNCPASGHAGIQQVSDDQLLKFTQDGKFVMQIGHSNQSKGNADTQNLNRPADAWVYPPTNDLFVADGYGNHRVIVYDANTGKFKRAWGAFGNKPLDDYHCKLPALSGYSDPGPQQFSVVHSIRVANDGLVYVADREYRRVQVFTEEGKFLKQLVKTDIPFARDLALSPDSDQRFLYVGGDEGIFIVERKTLEIVGEVQPAGIIGPGHEIATDSKGNLYIAQLESEHHAAGVQKLTFKGMSRPDR